MVRGRSSPRSEVPQSGGATQTFRGYPRGGSGGVAGAGRVEAHARPARTCPGAPVSARNYGGPPPRHGGGRDRE
eukprot:15462836-Alexandrium_andersonii.AAC.1